VINEKLSVSVNLA